jgi:hypothetical protein
VRAASASSACVVAPRLELDHDHAAQLLVPAQRHGRGLPETHRHTALRDGGSHVTGRRADSPRGPAVGRLAAQLVAEQVHVGALARCHAYRLLTDPDQQAAGVERPPQAARGPQETGGRVVHG